MKPIVVSSGEPAGVGPDLCLALAGSTYPIVVIGDKSLLAARAAMQKLDIIFDEYQIGSMPICAPNHLTVLSVPCHEPPVAGVLNKANASYVLTLLTLAAKGCLSGEFSALVTAPVHKSIINQAGFVFTGHTEFLADYCKTKTVVMMLASDVMRIALVTTHLPIKEVSRTITKSLLTNVLITLHQSLQHDFGISIPKIYVAGLNPHAGEGGYLGREEIDVISPVLSTFKKKGMDIEGPFPADTLFTRKEGHRCDAYLAMYHDQGLPVLKYACFGQAVNITLGLPIIRTSVDHGTALDLAGTGLAEAGSLVAAISVAANMVHNREQTHDNN